MQQVGPFFEQKLAGSPGVPAPHSKLPGGKCGQVLEMLFLQSKEQLIGALINRR